MWEEYKFRKNLYSGFWRKKLCSVYILHNINGRLNVNIVNFLEDFCQNGYV